MRVEAEVGRRSGARESVEAALVALILVNFSWTFVVQMFKIPSGSMVDNLLVGDHIVVNKFAYGPGGAGIPGLPVPLRDVRRGDVVVFRYPSNPAVDYVKRVVALPGETLEIRDKEVFIEGRRLEEPYVIHVDPLVIPDKPLLPRHSRDQFGPFRIPDGEYFMMGDNRDESSDSRYWGPVSRDLIKGRAFMVYWSYAEPPLPADASLVERAGETAAIATHLFSSTRWDRTFLIVDSRHHYHAERYRETRGE